MVSRDDDRVGVLDIADDKVRWLDGQGKVVSVVDRDGQRVGSYPLPAAMDVDEGHNYTLIRM